MLMIIGRTSSNAIKIKKDLPLGLRAVECSCCEQIDPCGLYPAQELYDEFYSPSDLPDSVTVDGISYARSGTSYGNTTNGVLLETNVWAKYKNSVRSARPTLLQKGVSDQFANAYTVTSSQSGGSAILQRTGACSWSTELTDSFCYTIEQGIWQDSSEFPPSKVIYYLRGWPPFVPYNNGGEVAFWELFKFNVIAEGNTSFYDPETGDFYWTSIIWYCFFAYPYNVIYKNFPGSSPLGEYVFVGSDGVRYVYDTIT